ncbi:hypothetical protein [Acetobacter papayae]|uniref:hypothetical protein n=1 Tax=Acetobacter papayae TaxID=1076592 RepID=UPI000B19BA9D|nr:hypothetical protein [Acetobacter papayae]
MLPAGCAQALLRPALPGLYGTATRFSAPFLSRLTAPRASPLWLFRSGQTHPAPLKMEA